MKELLFVLFLIVASASVSSAQSPGKLLEQLGQIKLLESNRSDIKKILSEYEATDDEDHFQEFSKDGIDIEVTYSSGKCSDDTESDEASEIWNVPEWRVTRIEISFDEPVKAQQPGVDLSRYKKSQRYPDDTDSFVFHDKVLGHAFKTNEDGIEKIIIFPSRGQTKALCRRMTAAKGFYIRNGWFSAAQPYDSSGGCINHVANVTDLDLDQADFDAGNSKTISVATSAVDPENDVLTYNYRVTGGQIVGTGAKVVWDLTGAEPGTYSITAGVDDGCGICGKTVTRTVIVK